MKDSDNTSSKQDLLNNDAKCLLNFSCFYHKLIQEFAYKWLKVYAETFHFLFNDYEVFEYYVSILGKLMANSLQPYNFYIQKVNIDIHNNSEIQLRSEKVICFV